MENQAEHRPNSTPRSGNLKTIMLLLQDTAQMRAGTMSRDSLRIYASRLDREPLEDVKTALEKLGEIERKEFEPAIPDIGGLLNLVRACTVSRQNRATAAKSERLVRWLCPDCKNTTTGFPFSGDDLVNRRCKSPYKRIEGKRTSLSAGQICGGRMDVVYDESQPDGVARKVNLPEWMTR